MLNYCQLASLTQITLVLSAVSAGFGSSENTLSTKAIVAADKLVYASDLFYVLAMFLARIAVALFFRRLAGAWKDAIVAKTILAASCLLAIICLILVGTQEHAGKPWVLPGPTHGQVMVNRWIAVEVMSDAIELAVLTYPLYVVTSLQMRRSSRLKAVTTVLSRLPIIALSILRVVSLSRTLVSDDFTYTYAKTQFYTQAEMCYTVVSATIVCLRVFLIAAHTGIQGIPGFSGLDASQLTHYSGSSRTLGSKRTRTRGTDDSIELDFTNRNRGQTVTRAARDDMASIASDTSETAIVVRQTVDVKIDGDDTSDIIHPHDL